MDACPTDQYITFDIQGSDGTRHRISVTRAYLAQVILKSRLFSSPVSAPLLTSTKTVVLMRPQQSVEDLFLFFKRRFFLTEVSLCEYVEFIFDPGDEGIENPEGLKKLRAYFSDLFQSPLALIKILQESLITLDELDAALQIFSNHGFPQYRLVYHSMIKNLLQLFSETRADSTLDTGEGYSSFEETVKEKMILSCTTDFRIKQLLVNSQEGALRELTCLDPRSSASHVLNRVHSITDKYLLSCSTLKQQVKSLIRERESVITERLMNFHSVLGSTSALSYCDGDTPVVVANHLRDFLLSSSRREKEGALAFPVLVILKGYVNPKDCIAILRDKSRLKKLGLSVESEHMSFWTSAAHVMEQLETLMTLTESSATPLAKDSAFIKMLYTQNFYAIKNEIEVRVATLQVACGASNPEAQRRLDMFAYREHRLRRRSNAISE